MIALVGGLGAALSWAVATATSSRTSRMIGPSSVLSWVMIFGLVVTAVPATMTPIGSPSAGDIGLLVLYGACYTGGLLLAYRALTVGRVSIVTPITSTEGAVGAVLSVVLGETLSPAMGATLAVIVAGVVLAGVERDPGEDAPSRLRPGDHPTRAVVYALSAACLFGMGFVASGKVGASVPIVWVVLVSRLVGALAIALPLALRRRLRLTRRTLPLVALTGVLEAVGTFAYVWGAQDSIAVAAVVSAQFAVFASLIAFVLFHERLARSQVAGVALVVVGVSALALLKA